MMSRNWFAVLLAGCLAFAVSVATVQPSSAVEFSDDVAVNEPQDGLSAQSAIEADEPSFDREPEPLPTGDFSDSFPVLIDDPDVTESMPQIEAPTVSAPGDVVSRDQFSETRDVGDGVLVREFNAVPVSTASPVGWVPIGTDFRRGVFGSNTVSVANNPLNPVVRDTAGGAGVVSVTHGEVSLSTQLLGAVDSTLSLDDVGGSDAAVFEGAEHMVDSCAIEFHGKFPNYGEARVKEFALISFYKAEYGYCPPGQLWSCK